MSYRKEYKKIKNLFLRQSYLDCWEDYKRSLQKTNVIKWDYIILTASNESQAEAFRAQIEKRLEEGILPAATKYVVLPDPDGKRVGSGGATFHVLRYLAQQEPELENPFEKKRILVIHSGGDSKRVPQYSVIGKLFSPVPHELPDGRASTLFDEFMVVMAGVPSRIREGMLVLSGDVLLLFNPLQIDAQFEGAAAISMKAPVETGRNHGVFLSDGNGSVKNFLHKQTEEVLKEMGAVNEQGNVDIDTGAVLISVEMLKELYELISTDGKPDYAKFQCFVNEEARVSFYGDMLYPLALESTLEQYYKESPEGNFTEQLRECRTKLWKVLRKFSLKLFCLSPAQFIHFGTTKELLKLMTEEISDYEFLDWKYQIMAARNCKTGYSAYKAYVGRRAEIETGVYLEEAYILEKSRIEAGSIVSHVKLRNVCIPSHIVLHGLPLKNEKQIVRIYGIADNPKQENYLNFSLKQFLAYYGVEEVQLWSDEAVQKLWNARLFPVCDTQEEAVQWALVLHDLVQKAAKGGKINAADEKQVLLWLAQKRLSLCESFVLADFEKILAWQRELEDQILCRKFIDALSEGNYYQEVFRLLGSRGMTEDIYRTLMEAAVEMDFSIKIRIYYAIARYMQENCIIFAHESCDYPENLCFQTIQRVICDAAAKNLPSLSDYRIRKERVEVQLPVRVNWGGGWTDTPPYCNEHGGTVLNAAITVNGILPIQIVVKKLAEYRIEFESQDIGVKGSANTVEEIQDCHNPYDSFALHKAAFIAVGFIPLCEKADLKEILKRIGGGIYLSTQVVGIPKGSGLGTSSILAGACVKGLFEFFGVSKTKEEIYEIVLGMEQIMSTGGGWQDQVGGLTRGIKLITTHSGLEQRITVEEVQIPESAMKELRERFALIYTGQRRLARNLLRDVVGGYIGARPESVSALKQMQTLAVLMKFHLERGEIDEFAELLNQHWELSKQLDSGSTNTCIDQIFMVCEDFIDARFIAGAGGGGFLMVILKKGISKQMLRERLLTVFQDSGVDVWESDFY